MDDSLTSAVTDTDSPASLGMSSFGVNDRQAFGQSLRLAMACIEGPAEPENTRAMPTDTAAIVRRLKSLTQDMTSHHADLLELLVRFDDLKGWQTGGALHCAGWMNLEMGISLQLGWEYLRVGRELRSLPTTTALFRAGKLSWSKIRLIASVAHTENEKTLCHAALDASVTGVKRLCADYRWKEADTGDAENDRALQQWETRSLRWGELSGGSTRIQLILPPEVAQGFLNSIDHSLQQLDDADSSISQRRADAAVRMAETSLQAAGRDIATADRYQVIVSVEASALTASELTTSTSGSELHTDDEFDSASELDSASEFDSASKSDQEPVNNPKRTPFRRPAVKGAGPIARETARRIACDCSVSTMTTTNGEPTDIGRKSRLWPSAMARAIKERDQHCQFPGCSQTRHLQIHHLTHWADGGTTGVSNGVCVCQSHHTLLHEGGYTVQRMDGSEQRLDEQFARQQHASDISQFDVEKDLRNDRQSFDQVRRLSPTCYRFRVVDAAGQAIRNRPGADADTGDNRDSVTPAHSTRVECREPSPAVYGAGISAQNEVEGTDETARSDSYRGFERASSSVIEQRAGYPVGVSRIHALVH